MQLYIIDGAVYLKDYPNVRLSGVSELRTEVVIFDTCQGEDMPSICFAQGFMPQEPPAWFKKLDGFAF